MSLRQPYIVLREAAGAYVNGAWVAGVRSVLTVQASVQPIKLGQDMQAVPEGRRLSDFVKVYTGSPLFITDEANSVQPDIIVSGGFGYELNDISAAQSGVLNHYRYQAAKVFAFTTAADWLSGAIKRP
jgi:hypothetical protein